MATKIAENSDPSATNQSKTTSVATNRAALDWYFPPYCELCSVYFPSETNSKTHFQSVTHKNCLQVWKESHASVNPSPESKSKEVICKFCWKKVNTQAIFEQHVQSPAHQKKEQAHLLVQNLKEQYRILKQSMNNQ